MNMKRMREITVSYHEGLLESLKDPEEAIAYLNAALEDGDQEVILLAWRDVLEANPSYPAMIRVIQLES